VGKNWTGRRSNHDKTKEVEMDRPYLEKEKKNTTRIAMKWNPEGKKKQGRPKQSWRRTVIKELESIGKFGSRLW